MSDRWIVMKYKVGGAAGFAFLGKRWAFTWRGRKIFEIVWYGLRGERYIPEPPALPFSG